MEKILVVDDDQDSLNFIKRILKKNHYKVITTTNILEALDLVQALKFNLILTDVRMPNRSGFDFVESLKRNKRFSFIPIIMITDLNEKKDVKKALKAGADDYILKPIDPLIIIQKVEQIFKNKETKIDSLQVDFTQKKELPPIEAEISLKVKITKIYEDGLDFLTDQNIDEGQTVRIKSSIFNEMKFNLSPPLRVFDSHFVSEENQWEINCCFFGLQESSMQKIRAWIYSKQTEEQRRFHS